MAGRSTDAGGLLLRETDRRLNLLARLAECFIDRRDPELIRIPSTNWWRNGVRAGTGYEDLNDHDQLRHDPVLRLVAGKPDIDQSARRKEHLAASEANDGGASRYSKITTARRDR